MPIEPWIRVETWYYCTGGYGIALPDHVTEQEFRDKLLTYVDHILEYFKSTDWCIDSLREEVAYTQDPCYEEVGDYTDDEYKEHLKSIISNTPLDSYDIVEHILWGAFKSEDESSDHCDQCGDYNWGRFYTL